MTTGLPFAEPVPIADRFDPAARIAPGDFYSGEEEKTKLNWFLFEYALELYSTIRRDKELLARLNGKGVGEAELAQFCVRYAKGTKMQILDKLAGKIPQVRFDYGEVEARLPAIGDALVDRVLTRAAEAWDTQTEGCAMCPTRCISERDQRCTMFDEPEYHE